MQRKRALFTLGLLVVVPLTMTMVGCGPEPAQYTDGRPVESSEKVVFLDQRLNNDLRVVQLGMTEPGEDRLQIKLTIQNLKDKPIECRVKYKFKTDDGFSVDETGWMPIIFDRREVTALEQKSLSRDATDFTVLIRYEKEIKGMSD